MASALPEHGERLVLITGEHWIKFVRPIVIATLLFLVSVLLFILAGITAHHYMWLSHATFLTAMILLLVTHHWFFIMLLSETLDSIAITNRRLLRMQYRMIIQEDILEVSFEKMKTVDVLKNGIIQNLLRYGTLTFETKATIPLVPHPNAVAKAIQEAMRSTD